jgi:CDP-diacylglycerol pyrophosphatase
LQSENAPNYWEAAWDARRFVEQGVRRQLLRDQIGMAINSVASRSQGQLHIHVSCIAPVVADFLRRHQAEIHGAWSPLWLVFGATFRNGKSGFYLLGNDPGASPRDTVSAEALLDNKCAN